MFAKISVVLLSIGAATPVLAQDLVFDIAQTLACVDAAGFPGAAADCIGLSANSCMSDTPGGSSTVVMGGCLDRELTYWDTRLNESYGALITVEAADDAQNIGTVGIVGQVSALKEMQRAWIPFRDAACAYEAAQWAGGTGAGPAAVGCLMRMTGEQVLYLERMAEEY